MILTRVHRTLDPLALGFGELLTTEEFNFCWPGAKLFGDDICHADFPHFMQFQHVLLCAAFPSHVLFMYWCIRNVISIAKTPFCNQYSEVVATDDGRA